MVTDPAHLVAGQVAIGKVLWIGDTIAPPARSFCRHRKNRMVAPVTDRRGLLDTI